MQKNNQKETNTLTTLGCIVVGIIATLIFVGVLSVILGELGAFIGFATGSSVGTSIAKAAL